MGKTGILLLNTGSPEAPTSDAVRSYLAEFLTDPRICPMNPRIWSFLLNRFILPKRSTASAAKYAAIWTEAGSPLDVTMRSLAGRLEASLRFADEDVAVARAMSYGKPSVGEALRGLVDRGCGRIVAIPLYPQSAFSTTGAVHDKLDEALAALDHAPEVAFVDDYYEEGAYIDAVAESIRAAGFGQGTSDRLLFAFHSIPISDIKGGDAYPEQTLWTAQAVATKLGLSDAEWRVGYQSRFDKSRSWLGPSVNAVLEGFPESYSDLFVVAPNFSVDCLETLYDIDIVLRRRYEGAGRRLRYVACLNDSDSHVGLLNELVVAQGIVAQGTG
ncbi:ferrochelatase [Adlercreutzia murintestinalis]|uniref:ferrochelatase n=1 Tax=Adlercreutzia murintestinalis TaxID=2941325 RepID=UPI00204023B6|nr:ferrochelatase [Adlercreutzia murintestinalis]